MPRPACQHVGPGSSEPKQADAEHRATSGTLRDIIRRVEPELVGPKDLRDGNHRLRWLLRGHGHGGLLNGWAVTGCRLLALQERVGQGRLPRCLHQASNLGLHGVGASTEFGDLLLHLHHGLTSRVHSSSDHCGGGHQGTLSRQRQ